MTATPGGQITPPASGTVNEQPKDGSSPIFAMLIGLAFASLAAFAAIRQRRTIGR